MGETHVFEIYIKTTPERLWDAITDPEVRAKYNFGASAQSDWKKGSSIDLGGGDALCGRALGGEEG